jgi:anti-sigma regulatory factor (Ser/Thr protein kinase)/CheY-like chemotaxis protein
MNEQELPPFQILWVEDEIELFRPGLQGLHQDRDKLTGIPGRSISVCHARTQKEADQRIAEAPPGGYDLILLDWKYPRDEGLPKEYLGLEWLPTLREAQPLACIAVLSGFATDFNLGPAVAALRDNGADEVIPKTIGWDETIDRLQKALAHRCRENSLPQRTKPYLSNVVRITAEDLQLAVGQARAELQLSDLGPGHRIGQASEILERLAQEVEKIGRRLPGEVKAELERVDCVLLAKQAVSRYLWERVHPIPVTASENCFVRTYRKDARNALNEILQNAVDAVNEVEPFPSYPAVRVDLKKQGNHVEITVSDRGRGFNEDAKKDLYKPDNCHWTKDEARHKGMGLYVTHRMMLAVGGRVEVESSKEGSKVTLVVPDWS